MLNNLINTADSERFKVSDNSAIKDIRHFLGGLYDIELLCIDRDVQSLRKNTDTMLHLQYYSHLVLSGFFECFKLFCL